VLLALSEHEKMSRHAAITRLLHFMVMVY